MLRNRTIIPFGTPGGEVNITYSVEGNSIVIREVLFTDRVVGDLISKGDDSTIHSGKEFELQFNSSEGVASLMCRLATIYARLKAKETGMDIKEVEKVSITTHRYLK